MPGSMPEHKDFIREFIASKLPNRILDVGPGAGTYADLLVDLGAEMIGIEIWGPYISMWDLHHKYDQIIIADIRYLDWDEVGNFDFVILGDVLEHMTEKDGRKMLKKAVRHSRFTVVSVPIVNFPQGGQYGNVHETHVEQYTPERLKALFEPFIIEDYREGTHIGAYILKSRHT